MSREWELKQDIEHLNAQLNALQAQSRESHNRATQAENRLKGMNSEIAELGRELRNFTNTVVRMSVLTESRSNMFLLEQRIEHDFGGYDEVRKAAAGLLRAAGDRTDWEETRPAAGTTLKNAGARYWLAPAAQAFSSWIDNDGVETERRVRQAVTADDAPASLFFGLILLRYRRREAALPWLRRYLATQNPLALDRYAARVFFAAGEGEFGEGGLTAAYRTGEAWMAEESAAERTEADAVDWEAILSARAEARDEESFPLLRKHCANWQEAEAGLIWAATQAGITRFFRETARDEAEPSPTDAPPAAPTAPVLLGELMTGYHSLEQPLRREYRTSRLLVEERGDTEAAYERLEREWPVARGRRLFSGLLAEILSGKRPAPARLTRMAVSLARPRLEEALDAMAAAARQNVPKHLSIRMNGWTGESENGANSSDLLASFSRHFDDNPQEEKKPVWMDEKLILPGAIAAILSLMTLPTIILPILILGGYGYYFYTRLKMAETGSAAENQERSEKRKDLMAALSGCLEEAASYRRLLALRSRELGDARDALRLASPALGSSVSPPREEEPPPANAMQPPAWDPQPPAMEPKRNAAE